MGLFIVKLFIVPCLLIAFGFFLEDFYQNDQPQYTETTIEEVDPATGAK